MRTYFLFGGGGVNVTVISVPGSQVVMMLTQIARDWGLITCLGTEFFGLSLIRPTVTVIYDYFVGIRF